MDSLEFANWLEGEIKKREWKPADLARVAKINAGTLSNILNGLRGAGPDFCTSIADALGLPPEFVFRKAGLLPPKPEVDPVGQELLHHLDDLGEGDRQRILTIVRVLAANSEGGQLTQRQRDLIKRYEGLSDKDRQIVDWMLDPHSTGLKSLWDIAHALQQLSTGEQIEVVKQVVSQIRP